jgi:hypothetical protein
LKIEEKILKRQGAKHAKGRGDFLTAKGSKEKVFLTTCHEILSENLTLFGTVGIGEGNP